MFSTALIQRMRYRHGFPFAMSIVLALMTYALPWVRGNYFHEGTSIWTFAILATLSTAFALLCGGRFRTFFIVIAVLPPFLPILTWYLRMRSDMVYRPTSGVVLQFFLYFVAAPILLVWIVGMLFNHEKKTA